MKEDKLVVEAPASENDHDQKGEKRNHKVTVVVDGKRHEVESGRYIVSQFKQLVHVDAAKELEQIVDGQFVPLEDSGVVTIKGHEQFVSHVRRGGSS